MLLFFSPAGMDTYFEEVLEPVQNRSAACLSGRCPRLCLRFAKSVTFGARLETERLGRLPRARGKGAYAVSIEGFVLRKASPPELLCGSAWAARRSLVHQP
jgi:hypothetical protein